MTGESGVTVSIGTNRDAMKVPAFRRLALGWVFSNFGDSVLFLTAAIWVKQLTGSDAAAGLVFAALGLPALLAPVTGRLADRYRRRPLVIMNNICAAVVVLALLLVRDTRDLWIVYTVIVIYSNTAYITAAAQSGLLRDLLPDRLLAPANGILSSIDQGLRIASPLLGAGMLALWGMDSVVLLTVACFLTAAAVLATLKLKESAHGMDPEESFWHSTTAGFRFLATHPLLRRALLTLGIAIGATGILNVTIFATVDQGLARPPEFLSILLGFQGVMAVAGGITASMVIRRFGIPATIAAGVLLLAAGLLTTAFSWVAIAFITLRQTETPAGMQGRTAAATQVVMNVPQVGASMIAAALIGIVDYRAMIVAMSALCALAVLPLVLGSGRSAAAESGNRTAPSEEPAPNG